VRLHGNFEKTPVVYNGPYEYSVPGLSQDWLPQYVPLSAMPKRTDEAVALEH
jgi:cytochrome c oxidase subunit 1